MPGFCVRPSHFLRILLQQNLQVLADVWLLPSICFRARYEQPFVSSFIHSCREMVLNERACTNTYPSKFADSVRVRSVFNVKAHCLLEGLQSVPCFQGSPICAIGEARTPVRHVCDLCVKYCVFANVTGEFISSHMLRRQLYHIVLYIVAYSA